MKRLKMCRVAACLGLAVTSMMLLTSSASASAPRPNILLLLADDLGFSDLGCFGGEVETPSIDRLAAEGLRFSHFRATPMCVTSRIALLAGMPMHRAGAHQYSHALPLPILMKHAGYRTMMTGKWHAGSPDPRSRHLFDRSFGFLSGMTDSFVGADDWFLDDKPFCDFDADFYSTHAFADKSIEFMKEAQGIGQPFFMYVAFNAPHHPCQAPEATVRKYTRRYLDGYQAIREQRHQRQIESGLVDPDWPVASLGNEVRDWSQLTTHRREVEAGRMAAYAAAVDEVDASVGKILDFLRDSELDQNTLVLFLSDNGGDYSNGAIDRDEDQVPWKAGHNPSSSNGWAAAKATPFRFYKHACHEGGIAVPMVVRWPDGIKRPAGETVDQAASITDLYPTFLDLAGIDYPSDFAGHSNRLLTGSTLAPLFHPDGWRSPLPLFEHYSFSRCWIEEEWKVVSLYGGPWRLYDLSQDRGETRDLSDEHPERLTAMVNAWSQFAFESDVPDAGAIASNRQPGWGWHRLKMSCPSLVSVTPDNGSVTESTTVTMRMVFDLPIDFLNTESKTIEVFSVSDESTPVWQADPDENHPSQGSRVLDLGPLPKLEANQQYYVRCSAGWIKVGGRPMGTLNDGAYWWRFRTPPK
ncbi:sulfatase-like hydrolase/transferase [Novipirellula artificiosorum]|uniref:Arylsulfatase n=1 Tax=Novipirellula artificiosorum TaxID=2528016 RepID=A0A5C6E4T2_9BACT|nr:sulfatase-like hydrolase/transferase [Novipirellula artificiosorum]TWU42436.1 Arylsulfatase [Novipirellula artificiosorum]